MRLDCLPVSAHFARAAALVVAPLLLAPLFASCGSNGPSGSQGTIVIKDSNNYTATSTLEIPVVKTAAGKDLEISWTGLKKDFLCHDVAPTSDINMITFLAFKRHPQSEIRQYMEEGKDIAKFYPDPLFKIIPQTDTSGKTTLSAVGFNASKYLPTVDGTSMTYLMLFSRGTTLGSGAATMAFLEPTDGFQKDPPDVAASDGCDILDFFPNLTTPAKVSAPVNGPWIVDWSQVTRDGMGVEMIDFSRLDNVLLAFYEGKDAKYLEEHFVDLDLIATDMYTMQIDTKSGNATVDLSKAMTSDSKAFAGFTKTNGVWALALGLRCKGCQLPNPAVVVILDPK